jgi:hypothetical protein
MPAIRARNCVPGLRTWPVMSTAEKDHPARPVIEAFKNAQRNRIIQLCAAADLAQPELLADELFLILEGARVTAQSMGRAGLGERLIRMGEAMIAAHQK